MAKFIELPIVTAISKENNRNIAFIIDDKDVIDSFYGDKGLFFLLDTTAY